MKTFQISDWWENRKRRRSVRPGSANGVLLISAGGLGDTVLFAHVVARFLKLAEKDERVTVLLRADAMKMAFLFPDGINFLAVDFGRLRKNMAYRKKVMENLFQDHYRLLVHTDFLRHPDLDEALVAAAMPTEAVAMKARPWRKYDTRLNANRRLYGRLFDSGPAHVNKVLRWSRFADWLTGTESPPPMAVLASTGLAPAAAKGAPTVVIQPFSAVKQKQPPPALYAQIIDSLPSGARVVITGAPGDIEKNPSYEELLNLPGVEFDDSVFAELVPLLRSADLVISVDTALMHLAVAVGAPTLCLASAAYVGEIVPYDPVITPDKVRFIYRAMPCEGCLGDCIFPPENGMYPCVAGLDSKDVLAGVTEMMAGESG
ncbi:MAG: lipopolysaccharide heptosyltransferase family protein [Rhodospirillales bacterium]|nr:lipopolysaccharide heptosyltransferase family protein [Rhodospirillales bacterium]